MADTQQSTGTIEEAASVFERMLENEENSSNPRRDDDEEDAAEDAEAEAEDETTDEDPEGDDEGAEDEANAEDEEAERAELDLDALVTVKIDGNDQQIPLKEAIAGYQRQADYTRKTQELAAHRNQFATEVQQLRQEREVYSHLLTALQQQVQGTTAEKTPEYWARLRAEDPVQYSIEYTDHLANQEKLRAIQAEQQRLQQSSQAEQARALQEYVAQERQKLLQAKPEWRDDKVRQQALSEVRDYAARTYGFTPEELNNAFDHRAILAMHKAMAYDRMMAKAKGKNPSAPAKAPSQGKPPVQQKAPVLKPSSAPRQARESAEFTRDKQRLAKTGSLRDAAKVFERFV